METVYINLDGVETVKRFVNTLTQMSGEFDLIQGKYVVDAKSILGIFSLDLERPIELRIYEQPEMAKKELEDFIETQDLTLQQNKSAEWSV